MVYVQENLLAGLEHEYDVFEPTFLEAAFKRKMHLGPLIFGRTFWKAHFSRQYGLPALDPISIAFKRHCRTSFIIHILYVNEPYESVQNRGDVP